MAIYRQGQASMDAQGYVTGYDTKWREQLTLIRPGATIFFLTQPLQAAVITEVISDTSIRAITTGGAVVQKTNYLILLHDSLTVDGLAQNVAETLRYYQSKESEIGEALELLKTSKTNAKNSENAANASKSEAAISVSDALASKNAAKASEDRLVQGTGASGETAVSSADGTKRIFVKNNGDWGMWDSASKSDIALPISKGGTGAKDANGIRNNIGLNSQHSPTFSGVSIKSGWPAVVLNSTSVDSTYIGRRIYAENNKGDSLNIFFAQEGSQTDRRTIFIEKPTTTESRYISFDGGLALGGTSYPNYTSANMNEAHQGWRNWGGAGTGTPQSGNVYGSLFTQCTQGLLAGRSNNTGTNGRWYQQRFYDTSNRIFSRIQTNDSSWGGWVQLTTSAVSDERLKDVMGDMNVECALDNINRMEFKLFKFKEEHTTKKNVGATRRGVISQQIRAIDKEYTKDVGGFWHLDQTPMLLDGLAAIKALRARDVDNKERISKLEKEVAELKELLSKLINNPTTLN